LNSGRPAIVVPPGAGQFAMQRALTGWDGSAQAERALNDALPVLRVAEHVEIVRVAGEKDVSGIVPPAKVAPHLELHGVNASSRELVAPEGDVADPSAEKRTPAERT
jgi:hypothetical protein